MTSPGPVWFVITGVPVHHSAGVAGSVARGTSMSSRNTDPSQFETSTWDPLLTGLPIVLNPETHTRLSASRSITSMQGPRIRRGNATRGCSVTSPIASMSRVLFLTWKPKYVFGPMTSMRSPDAALLTAAWMSGLVGSTIQVVCARTPEWIRVANATSKQDFAKGTDALLSMSLAYMALPEVLAFVRTGVGGTG